MTDKLFVGLPIYGDVDPNFMQSMMRLQANPPCELAIFPLMGDSLVSRARNTVTARFLETDCTHLLFIDSDLIFSVEHVARIMSHKEEVVGGFYAKKQAGPPQWVCNACFDFPPTREDGLQEVRYIGTGFIRIARTVFDQMLVRWGSEIGYTPDHLPGQTHHDFWPVGPYHYQDGTVRFLSEDWYFCQRWLDLGGKVWGDTRTVLRHVGQAVYPLTKPEEWPTHSSQSSSAA